MAKLGVDAAAQLGAFAVMAVSGVGLNLAILGIAGDAGLGVFNQVYAVYVVGGQLAVFGVHDAVHRSVAAQIDGRKESIDAGWMLAACGGVVGAAALAIAAEPLGALADSREVSRGIQWLVPAIVLFAVNKVLMAALGGQGRLVEAAAVQVARVVGLLAAGVGATFAGRPHGDVAAAFLVAEGVATPLLVWRVAPGLRVTQAALRAHATFGARALPHGFVAESFLRVDVLMLAPFVSDAAVGVYSLAAMVGEGIYQVGSTLRGVMAPRVIPLLDRPGAERSAALRTAMGYGAAATVAVAAGSVALFPLLGWALDGGTVQAAHGALALLALGLVVYSPWLPLDGLLLWAAQPGRQSVMMVGNLATNVALNLLLIPTYGVMGAAAATALAWAASACSLQLAARWALGWRGGVLGEALRRR